MKFFNASAEVLRLRFMRGFRDKDKPNEKMH